MSGTVSNFPFLKEDEFAEACEELQNTSDYQLFSVAPPILRLRKTIVLQNTSHKGEITSCGQREADEADEVNEVDEELVPAARTASTTVLTYDIVLSPSYQVPVIYIRTDFQTRHLEQLYDAIVPNLHRNALDAVGTYGALSMTDHPFTGVPAYFLHPCRTADALRESYDGHKVSPLEYMMLWFGLIGTSVGLSIPVTAALRSTTPNRSFSVKDQPNLSSSQV